MRATGRFDDGVDGFSGDADDFALSADDRNELCRRFGHAGEVADEGLGEKSSLSAERECARRGLHGVLVLACSSSLEVQLVSGMSPVDLRVFGFGALIFSLGSLNDRFLFASDDGALGDEDANGEVNVSGERK